MNWEQVRDQWRQLPGRAKARWSELTDEGVGRLVGMRDRLIGGLRARVKELEVWAAGRPHACVSDAKQARNEAAVAAWEDEGGSVRSACRHAIVALDDRLASLSTAH